jgi:hypothetical protein
MSTYYRESTGTNFERLFFCPTHRTFRAGCPMGKSEDRLRELCSQATREQDAERVREIIGEILSLLAEKQKALRRPPNDS